jgi:hypothetical protein
MDATVKARTGPDSVRQFFDKISCDDFADVTGRFDRHSQTN